VSWLSLVPGRDSSFESFSPFLLSLETVLIGTAWPFLQTTSLRYASRSEEAESSLLVYFFDLALERSSIKFSIYVKYLRSRCLVDCL